MFYHSYDAEQLRYRVGLATSPDGFSWTKQGPVFNGSAEGSAHDARGAASCHVVYDSDIGRWVGSRAFGSQHLSKTRTQHLSTQKPLLTRKPQITVSTCVYQCTK